MEKRCFLNVGPFIVLFFFCVNTGNSSLNMAVKLFGLASRLFSILFGELREKKIN